MAKSIEEKVEDFYKSQLKSHNIKYFSKTDSVNDQIDTALKNAVSKQGGKGGNYPDIRCLVNNNRLPVMIEAKGTQGRLVKFDKMGNIELLKKYEKDTKTHKTGEDDYSTISNYAVNGAVHYARAIIENTDYKECLAVGINGYKDETEKYVYEMAIYYVAEKNMLIPKVIEDYSDLTFLKESNIAKLLEKIEQLNLTPEDIEKETKATENELDGKLRNINQLMQDTLQINVNFRVDLIIGMIMAGLGVKDDNDLYEIDPLKPSELKGKTASTENDGSLMMNKIRAFLDKKNIPAEKKEMIVSTLGNVFNTKGLWTPINGESKIKSIYAKLYNEILPIFNQPYHLDFTGKLFNVLNDWVPVPDGDKNDVVLTPRYVTELMAKLCKVDMNSYVWDYATGSAGFLVSSMKIMLEDAKKRLGEGIEYRKQENKIKTEQLLGVELLPDIYMLAVLNMILMKDGSTNILNKNSLTEFEGKYEYGERKGTAFPANVFLLNPPYSAAGKGMVFVKAALDRMTSGRAAILIQENAGSGQGGAYTKEILKNNTLLASIHMADIFCGKAGVQTAIYVFEVGHKHNENQLVKFIDFSNDGYERQNRKKSDLSVNLRNKDHAHERYEEVVNLVLYGKDYLHYLTNDDYIEDKITLEGNDWTFNQHKKIDITPTEEDFKRVVAEYLSWKVSTILKGQVNTNV